MANSAPTEVTPPARGFFRHLLSPWTWRMAWRDSRTSRRRLLLLSCSIVLGVAALTAIGSLGSNLERAIGEQAKAILGADLVLSSREPFSPEAERLFQQLGGEQSREISFSTMIYFPHNEGTRLVQARLLSGGFPFYGQLETEPASATAQFRGGHGALVEETLLTQFAANVGDNIRLGNLTTPIIGVLKKVPGETATLAAIAPRVFLSLDNLPQTGLLRPGSLAQYKIFFKFPPGVDAASAVREIQPQLDKLRLRHETVADRKREFGRSLDNLYHFLNLVGFIALLLGGVGVASAIHVHVKQKLGTVALLRCLGGSIAQTFAIYLVQGMALGCFGALTGAALGIAIQSALPRVLADFIPFTFHFSTSWFAVGRAVLIGFSICLLFALLPLLAVRRVSPLAAIRAAVESDTARRDPLRWLVGASLATGILGFALTQSRDWRIGLGFTLGLGIVFAILAGTASILVYLTRKFTPATLSFAWRQGLANLHRPNNRTLLLLLSLGLGTFLMLNLYLVQQTLLTQLISSSGTNQANTILFDIQPDQREPVINLVRSMNLPILDEAPIVTMRLTSVKGRPVESLLADKQKQVPNWSLRHEYRSTYSDHLRDGEKIIAGRLSPSVAGDTNPVPVSVEAGLAGELHVTLGDELVFDVQGVPITARVASLRQVEWRRIQPNFFLVFPPGVLEEAPATHVLVTHVPSADASARLQRDVVKSFPNVSAIDLRLVLQTLDSLLGKISFVVRFMAMFTVLTGLLVLVGALLTGRYQRIQESILLRTLGASRGQIFKILFVEYFSLGLLAALTGIFLALLATWALSQFVFHVHFAPSALPLLIALLAVPALTVVTGLLMSRGVLNQPPLAILRSES
ncbi:MAG: transporter permease [Pedosphaera sp.]|nr:transporter permease [Pedosphaera sp.]